MFKQVKKWLNNTGGKYVIVENGKPKYVIMKAEEYQNLIAGNPGIDDVNQEIVSLKEAENQTVDISLDKQE